MNESRSGFNINNKTFVTKNISALLKQLETLKRLQIACNKEDDTSSSETEGTDNK
ncbi:1386_t:CDS:2, partial [Cetraspora pellucida]